MNESVKVLTVGDVVGAPGRRALRRHLRALRRERDVDLVVVNAENVTNGSGISAHDARELLKSGVDVITTGDHVWRKRDVIALMEEDERLIRAANFTRHASGRGHTVVTTRSGVRVGVTHVIGRVFMPPIDCPFAAVDAAVDRLLEETPVIVVDVHCEATSEKVALGRFLDGRASAVFGTHTHVPTADAQVLPGGTGYITDVGMTGPYDSILGRRADRVLHRFVTGMPAAFDVAEGDVRIAGALFTIDAITGRCRAVERIEVPVRTSSDATGSGASEASPVRRLLP